MKLALSLCLALFTPGVLVAQNQGLLQINGGADVHIDVPYHPTLIPQSGITVEASFTYDEALGGSGNLWPTLVRHDPDPGEETYMLRVDASNVGNRNLRWLIRTENNGSVSVDYAFNPGEFAVWSHVAGTYDGTTSRLIVNGIEVGSAPATGRLVDQFGPLRIGNGDVSSPGAEVWNGEIDEVRVWPFARTAAEVAGSMNDELTSVPSEVSTWNLNGDGSDSSLVNDGAIVGTLNFVANAAPLTAFLPAFGSFGAQTPGCTSSAIAGISSTPRLGNAGFGFTSIRSGVGVSGVMFLSPAPLAAPIDVLGADLWVNPGGVIQIPVGLDALATAKVNLPIPNLGSLASAQFSTQFFWLDLTCGAQLLSATDGVSIAIQP